MNLRIKISTFFSVGVLNVIWFVWYKIKVIYYKKTKKNICCSKVDDVYFSPCSEINQKQVLNSNTDWLTSIVYFSWYKIESSEVPDWYLNPFDNKKTQNNNVPWYLISDFSHSIGDIKTVWEASRFDWMLSFAQSVRKGKQENLNKLNFWINDWMLKNPPYIGFNWKCGQEASIRVIHIAISSFILKQVENPTLSLIYLIKIHLKRINSTLCYALAQDNNHGTSEAAALFIGGSWLLHKGYSEGKKWQNVGRKWLENRVKKLVLKDGTFSQYSMNYHRLMLDTVSVVEIWRNYLCLQRFSPIFYERISLATKWLYQFIQFDSGNVPNIGANDGALLLPLVGTDYRDFRPSMHLSMVLFTGQRAWAEQGPWDDFLKWFEIEVPQCVAQLPCSVQFDYGGFSLLRKKNILAVLRYPRFIFRPSQSDALHVDFWIGKRNLLRDAGSYSYNTTESMINYFSGTKGHNTIQFDERNQMPRLGRFLFGSWLKSKNVTYETLNSKSQKCAASYTDIKGASHSREIILRDNVFVIKDKVNGFKNKAVLRWRLDPTEVWTLNGFEVFSDKFKLVFSSNVIINRIEIVEGLESVYYLKKTNTPIVEIEVNQPCKLKTELFF
ncbi:alginate lyase family protein [Zooshikella marina]|uniref:alginate lyase family protein n=1 Tax=Zooshikella ganghwensis TaxID=202772 RepID=UPI001BAF207C|nr:alginate lyase family protein [Zooshikella ganghwensis]MBU2704607.1 alginate lyase family protein [Zooshikella ganghwensis]